MKTTMQQLIDYLQSEEARNGIDIYDKANKLLSVERKQIEESYHEGQRIIVDKLIEVLPRLDFSHTLREFEKVDTGKEPNEEAQSYYNSKYGGNKIETL